VRLRREGGREGTGWLNSIPNVRCVSGRRRGGTGTLNSIPNVRWVVVGGRHERKKLVLITWNFLGLCHSSVMIKNEREREREERERERDGERRRRRERER